ncbi:hypothetical protein [uncultured Clostridium sp.]|uniref:hypothetical protein n=1 Tax=uncultured Clostridium sp. TaxID=59620 RepID=UPI0028E62D72|nr:hypothetical protein [uncultured Clostridium sp.]
MLELSLKEQKQINGGKLLYVITGFKNGKIFSTYETFSPADIGGIEEMYYFNEGCDKVTVKTIRV